MLYVVTAVHNRFNITKRFVEQLKSQSYEDYKLVLVDDGCTDGTPDMVLELLPDAVILQGDGNLFWGGALHKAYCWLRDHTSSDDYVMFANDDTHFQSEYLSTAMNLLKKNENCMITGCGYSVNTGKQIDGVVHWDYKTGKREENWIPTDSGNCASTRSLFFSAQTMKRVGGFHPILLPHYGSDYEWTLQASQKKIAIQSFEELKYTFDEGTTGDNNLNNLTAKKLFSKRSIKNPVYRMIFVMLSTPVKYLPVHLCYQIARYAKKGAIFFEILKK